MQFSTKQLGEIFQHFRGIMYDECRLRPDIKKHTDNKDDDLVANKPQEIYDICWRLLEIALSSLTSRGYNSRYGITEDGMIAYESVAAHTHLAMAILDEAIKFCYGNELYYDSQKQDIMLHNYRLWDIREAIRIHDLPENEYGDTPDNGSRDELAKITFEMRYFDEYFKHYPTSEQPATRVKALLINMSADSVDPVAKLIYLADKVSAIIITLAYDLIGESPTLHYDDPTASERDKQEMALCDYSENGWCCASEMWTIDHLKIRQLCRADDYGFFTALIVMATLLVHENTWYDWREADYKAGNEANCKADNEANSTTIPEP